MHAQSICLQALSYVSEEEQERRELGIEIDHKSNFEDKVLRGHLRGRLLVSERLHTPRSVFGPHQERRSCPNSRSHTPNFTLGFHPAQIRTAATAGLGSRTA